MKIPLLDVPAQLKSLEGELIHALSAVIHRGDFILGTEVAELEKQISQYLNIRHCIGVSSGTDALLLALMALDIGPGDFVVTTDYSFFATAGVISRVGARPIFVDIDLDTYNINPQSLKNTLHSLGQDLARVKGIIPVHLFGQSADMPSVVNIAKEYNIPIIEDAAQAIGTICAIDNATKKAGTIGLMGCFSFFPSKNLGGIGDAGMIVTADDNLAEKLKKLRVHGAESQYYHSMIGGNFRIDTIQAAALLVKLPHLEYWHKKRQQNAAYYDEHLAANENISRPYLNCPRDHHIYNQYVISVNEKRDELRQFLANNNIGTAVYYPLPFHLQPCFSFLENEKGLFPNSEYAARHSLALPIFPELSTEQQDYVVEKMGEFFAKH